MGEAPAEPKSFHCLSCSFHHASLSLERVRANFWSLGGETFYLTECDNMCQIVSIGTLKLCLKNHMESM